MKRRWFLFFWAAWVGIASLYFLTSMWWGFSIVILAIAGGVGFEEYALFFCGWPMVVSFVLGAANSKRMASEDLASLVAYEGRGDSDSLSAMVADLPTPFC